MHLLVERGRLPPERLEALQRSLLLARHHLTYREQPPSAVHSLAMELALAYG